MKNHILFGAVIVSTLLFVGCNKGNHVSGKVTFPDGSPLTVGNVCFENDKNTLFGPVNSNGEYVLNGPSPGVGIPDGKYGVYISGAVLPGDSADGPVELDSDGNPLKRTVAKPDTQLVHNKFARKSTSGIECDVKGKTTLDITVEKP